MKPFLNCHIVEVGSRYRQVAVFQLTIPDKRRESNTWCVSLQEDGLCPELGEACFFSTEWKCTVISPEFRDYHDGSILNLLLLSSWNHSQKG